MTRTRWLLAAAALTVTSSALAESPERVTLEVGLGPYRPEFDGSAFDDIYGGERGPLLAVDAAFHVVRIPHVGPIGVHAGFSWARYSANACLDVGCTQRSSEDVDYDLYPLSAGLHLRIDTLWDEWHIPFFFSGVLGAEYVRFRENKGGEREAAGGAFGLFWRGQVAFVLDILEPRAARSLDENHGINHSYLYFELRGATAASDFPVADRFTWLGGLGLVF